MHNIRVLVPKAVMDGMLAIRSSGRTNMFDLSEVVRIAVELDYIETAMRIENNRAKFCLGIFHGFKVMEGER
ncbi:MAG: DUF5049 domain-containing protein [Armatimonadota bacterium]